MGELAPGTIIHGHYEIIASVGKGGMGTVYRARDTSDGSIVAVKTLNFVEGGAHRRFLREFNLLNRIRHHRIVRSRTWGLHEGMPFFCMDFIRGRPLSNLIAESGHRERLRSRLFLPLVSQIGEGLAYIHGCGLVHRDIKPSNIMVREDDGNLDVKIMDLGLARFQESRERRLTQPGTTTGTVEYMSPEQIRGRSVDQRSDLYSIGIILYEILTGNPPFAADLPATVILGHLKDRPRPPYIQGISDCIPNVVMKLLEKEPSDRYSSVENLLRDLVEVDNRPMAGETQNASMLISPAPFLAPQFQGREKELRTLRAVLAEPGARVGRIVLISGEAGIGKTQVLEEFQADARVHGMRVLAGRCYEGGGRAYGPFLDALMDLEDRPGIQGSDLEKAVKCVLAQIERTAASDKHDPYPFMEILSQFLLDLSRETPTLVCVEDIQWADDQSLRFLGFMRRDTCPTNLVFCLTCRKEGEDQLSDRVEAVLFDGDAAGIAHLRLKPLSFEETRDLAASMVGEPPVPDDEARRIFVETGGNPLFAVELIRGSIEKGLIRRNSTGGWTWLRSSEWPMPAGITQAIESRLGRLRSGYRRALEYASIFPGAFSFDLIAELWPGDELRLLEALERIVRLGLLKSLEDRDGRYQFSHGLIQREVYQVISEGKLELLHLKAGRALELRFKGDELDTLEDLAYHYSRSNDHEKMVDYVTIVGRNALRMHDFSHALHLFEAVLKKGPFSIDAPARIARGSAAHLDLLCAYAEALSGCNRYEVARRKLEEVMGWVSEETLPQKAWALRMLGINHVHSCDYQKAKSALRESLRLFRVLGDEENELTLLGLLQNVYIGLKNVDGAVRLCNSAAAKCRELGGAINEARALIFQAFAAENRHRIERSKTLLESSLELLEMEGDRVHRYACLYLLARVEFRLGHFDRAEAIFKEIQAFRHRCSASGSEARAHLHLSRIALERGDLETAESHARAATQLLTGGTRSDEEYKACAILAETLAENGRVDEAVVWSQRAWPGIEYGGDVRALVWTARAKALTAAGRHDEVDSLFGQALKVQGSPDGMEQVNLLVVAGAYFLVRGGLADARLYLESAREAADRMGLQYYAHKAADLLEKSSKEAEVNLPAREMYQALSEAHLLTLYETSEDLTSVLDLNLLLDRILDRLKDVSRAERVMIALRDEAALNIEVARKHNMDDAATQEISRGIIKWAMDRNEVVSSLDAQIDDRFKGRQSVTQFGIRSVLCVPLRHAESGVIGALYMDHREFEGRFTDRDSALLSAFGNLVSIAVFNARMYSRTRDRVLYLERQSEGRHQLEELVGQSQAMQEVYKLVDVAAENDMNVLIQGETGTGKELAARAIHTRSMRREQPFLSANCAALSPELIQSELFGHKKGAFTGAVSDRKGLFESAAGGTVLLDEIGDGSSHLQSSLLRVLQDGEIQRVGETQARNVDVRVIAATNRDLEADVRAGSFREDLFYRLRVLQIEMPTLRGHIEDIPLLSQHVLKRVCADQLKSVPGFTVGAIRVLMDHGWPGNVRELDNEIRRAVALVDDGKEITEDLFSEKISRCQQTEVGKQGYFKSRMAALEKRMIVDALDQVGRNITRAADSLGLSRNGLQKMMTRHGLR